MGPAILSCPSSSAVQLLAQASPSKNLVLFVSNGSLGYAHGTTEFPKKAVLSASFAGKCRENSYPLAWKRVFAAAAVEEPALIDETPVENSTSIPAPEEGTNAEPKSAGKKSPNRSNSSGNRAAVLSPAELVPGATFTGKVTNIQPFGAFVDFGAFTNGLVHISRLSKGYVEKVEDVVQNGQDVNVQILDVDFTGNRISLMLVEEESKEEALKEGDGGEEQAQGRSPRQGRNLRRDTSRRARQSATPTTTMKKGEIAIGTVKNIIKSGVFLTLPDGTDGYLPAPEVVFKTPYTNLEALFQVGQEVTVRVLRLEKGRVTLSTKQEMDYTKINEDLNKDVVGCATSPFEIAFRRSEAIANFLAGREKQKSGAEVPLEERPPLESVAAHRVNGVVLEEISEQEQTSVDSLEEHEDSKEPVTSPKDMSTSSDNESSPAESVEKLDEGVVAKETEDVKLEANETRQSKQPMIASNKEDVKESSINSEAVHVAEVVSANAQQC
eukprot:c23977_g1_i1 orf=376-1866(+)